MRILVVEDEKKVAGFIKKGLEEETYAVDVAYDGEDGLHLGSGGQYDLIILDIMLPKMDGLEVLSQLRDQGRDVPIRPKLKPHSRFQTSPLTWLAIKLTGEGMK